MEHRLQLGARPHKQPRAENSKNIPHSERPRKLVRRDNDERQKRNRHDDHHHTSAEHHREERNPLHPRQVARLRHLLRERLLRGHLPLLDVAPEHLPHLRTHADGAPADGRAEAAEAVKHRLGAVRERRHRVAVRRRAIRRRGGGRRRRALQRAQALKKPHAGAACGYVAAHAARGRTGVLVARVGARRQLSR